MFSNKVKNFVKQFIEENKAILSSHCLEDNEYTKKTVLKLNFPIEKMTEANDKVFQLLTSITTFCPVTVDAWTNEAFKGRRFCIQG